MNAPAPVALARLGKATAIVVVMGLGLVFVPFGPMVIMPFLPLPLAHVSVRYGFRYGMVLAVVAGGLVFLGAGPGYAALVFLTMIAVGVSLAASIRRQWTFGRTLAVTAGSALAALCLWGATLWLALGVDLTRLREAADGSIDGAAGLYGRMGVAPETITTVSGQMRSIIDVMPFLAPGLLAAAALLLVCCTIGLAYVIFPRLQDKVELGMSLSGFRLHWATAYASIAGLALIVLARGAGDYKTAVLYVGINVLLFSQTLFFVQGLALAHWLVRTRGYRSGARAGIYIVAVLGQVLLQLTGVVGLFDTWLDYRKRFALKSPGAGSVR